MAACPSRTPTPTASSPAPSLATNDIDFRARPHSAEEADFLASTVVATGPMAGAVTYADLEAAKTVVLVGFEPEEESPIVFLRLRKASPQHKTAVYAVAPFATRGLTKLDGTLIPAAPGTEAEVLRALADGVTGDGAAATAAQALGSRARSSSSASASPPSPVRCPRRLPSPPRPTPASPGCPAGPVSAVRSRPAPCPTLLPGGRPVADAAARQQVAEAWDVVGLPDVPGRDAAGILEAATTGAINALRRRWRRRRRPGRRPQPRKPSPRPSSSRSTSGPRR